MSILRWIEANVLHSAGTGQQEELTRLRMDLQKLMADAESLRARGSKVRQGLAAALARCEPIV